jgi:hypothetical protein
VTRFRLLKAAADDFATPVPPPVPVGIEFASSDEEDDAEEPPPPPPLFPADLLSPSGSAGEFGDSPTPPPPKTLPPLPPPLDVNALARELLVQGLTEEEQVAIAMEERCG